MRWFGVREGDLVVGRNFAEAYNMGAERLFPIPKSDIPIHHWIVEPVSCVVTGLDHCNLKAGDRIAVIGCGYMGLMMIQGLAHSLVDRLIAIDINPARLKLADEFGADTLINPAERDEKDLVSELREQSLDTVVDASGAQPGLDLATKIVKPGGRINLFGWNHGATTFSGDSWHLRGLTVVNSAPGSRIRETFPTAIRLLAKKLINPEKLITHVVTLEEFPGLMDSVVKGNPEYIKGVVKHAV